MDVEDVFEHAEYIALYAKYQKMLALLRSASAEIDAALHEFRRGRAQHAKSRLARLQARLSAETENVEI